MTSTVSDGPAASAFAMPSSNILGVSALAP